ncbi:MAG: polymerase [Chloroflexota bacterium]|nr:polymerase [Chloroflexota bacterium]
MTSRNEDVAMLLENVARLLTLKGDSPFRIRAYLDAAYELRSHAQDVEALHRSGHLTDVPGIGPSIAAKIGEYLDTGRVRYLEELKLRFPVEATDLLDVPSIGPARAQVIHERLGVSTLPELERAAHEHRLRELPGFGPKLEERIAREAEAASQRASRAA